MTTALFLLRALQLGLRLEDLDHLSVGDVMDLMIESGNDHEKYQELAGQEDFDKF